MNKATKTAHETARKTTEQGIKILENVPSRGKLTEDQSAPVDALVWASQQGVKSLIAARKADTLDKEDKAAIRTDIDELTELRNRAARILTRGKSITSGWKARESGNLFGYFA